MGRAAVDGETRAAWWLRRRGWRIVARNWRRPGGEIDLVARRGRVLAVCEVKARGRAGWLREPLRADQAARLARMAERFLLSHPEHAGCVLRVDLITVAGRGPVRRIRRIAAAVPGDGGRRGRR